MCVFSASVCMFCGIHVFSFFCFLYLQIDLLSSLTMLCHHVQKQITYRVLSDCHVLSHYLTITQTTIAYCVLLCHSFTHNYLVFIINHHQYYSEIKHFSRDTSTMSHDYCYHCTRSRYVTWQIIIWYVTWQISCGMFV